jgi:hypothetical protein
MAAASSIVALARDVAGCPRRGEIMLGTVQLGSALAEHHGQDPVRIAEGPRWTECGARDADAMEE